MGCPEQYDGSNHDLFAGLQLQCIGGDAERGPTPRLAMLSGLHLCVEAEPLVSLAEVLAHGSSMRFSGGLRTSRLGSTRSKELPNRVTAQQAQLRSVWSLFHRPRNVAREQTVGVYTLVET